MRIDTRSRGKRESFDATGDTVAHAFGALDTAGRAIVSVSEGGVGSGSGRLVQAQRTRRGTWRIRTVDLGSQQAARSSRSGHVDQATAERALTAYVGGDPDWQAATKLTVGLASRSPALLIPATFVVATAAALGVTQLTGNLDGFDRKYLPNLIVGVALISGIGAYTDVFFRVLRPRIAAALGARLGVRIVESNRYGWFSRPGFWEADGGAVMSALKAGVGDFVLVIVGLVLPITAFATAAVLAADRFLA